MDVPFFFIDDGNVTNEIVMLNEDTSRHIVQVLRMKIGEEVNLTDGKGKLIRGKILQDHKKAVQVKALSINDTAIAAHKTAIAISLIKNANRFEWFLEKATELGISEIIPMICERTEKQHFRYDRMNNILISAMLQSKQLWLPLLHQPASYIHTVASAGYTTKLIAHCLPDEKTKLADMINESNNAIILIGPEGDFTEEEIRLAKENNYIPVSLGNSRLRTETAGVAAAVVMKL